jgi:cysteinyl-tRNA synthetase
MREVTIRDTLSGEPRAIEADDEGVVGIYACGPTVYSRIHIGNARPFVVFSLLRRFLESEGYAARLVVNVTDVNDKIYTAADAAGKPSAEWATPTGSGWEGPTRSRWRPRRSPASSA